MHSRNGVLCAISLLALTSCVTFPNDSDYLLCDFDAHPISPPVASSSSTHKAREWLSTTAAELRDCDERGAGLQPERFSLLSLSGGGPDGAFGAGFLAKIISRPTPGTFPFHPCIVTGVSTGAVMGSYVYLATSRNANISNRYLTELSALYPSLDDDALIKEYAWYELLPVPVSTYDVKGLRATLAKKVDETLLQAVLEEYRTSHRRLWVGATDLISKQFEIIDLTDFVARHSGRLSDAHVQLCYQEAIRASAAIPVLFPLVPILDRGFRKMYVDGGARYMMFMDATDLAQLANGKELWIYGVINNTFYFAGDGAANPMNIFKTASLVSRITADQLYLDSAFLVDSTAATAKAKRQWATPIGSVEALQCVRENSSSKIFDPKYESCLQEAGSKKEKWDEVPPVVHPIPIK